MTLCKTTAPGPVLGALSEAGHYTWLCSHSFYHATVRPLVLTCRAGLGKAAQNEQAQPVPVELGVYV